MADADEGNNHLRVQLTDLRRAYNHLVTDLKTLGYLMTNPDPDHPCCRVPGCGASVGLQQFNVYLPGADRRDWDEEDQYVRAVSCQLPGHREYVESAWRSGKARCPGCRDCGTEE